MSKWISVHDSVPEKEVTVIVNLHYEDGVNFVTTGWTYRDINDNVIWYVEDTDPEDGEDYIITHWRPFPKPPKEEEILAEIDPSMMKIYNQEVSEVEHSREGNNMSGNNGGETWLDKMFIELAEEVPTFTLFATDKDSDGLDTYVELGEASANIIKRDNKEE